MIPYTQLDAYNTITEKEAKQLIVLKAILQNNGSTLFELVKILKWPINRISGRVTELKKQGKIVDSGLRKMNPESNKSAIVWIVNRNNSDSGETSTYNGNEAVC